MKEDTFSIVTFRNVCEERRDARKKRAGNQSSRSLWPIYPPPHTTVNGKISGTAVALYIEHPYIRLLFIHGLRYIQLLAHSVKPKVRASS